MTIAHQPLVENDIIDIIKDCQNQSRTIEVLGSGSKRSIGRQLETDVQLSLSHLDGVLLYEPNELVISLKAGTPLTKVKALLAEHNQHLPFEPIDFGALFGAEQTSGTIGAVFQTNCSGSRRMQAGSARDHLLGIKAVNGRGELFKAGGRVMKNVTGYDIARTLTNSWGTLAVFTEVTFKVLPKALSEATLVIYDLEDKIAIEAMTAAIATPFEISGAGHFPNEKSTRILEGTALVSGRNITALRLENFQDALDYRIDQLQQRLDAYGSNQILPMEESRHFWTNIQKLNFTAGSEKPLWRICTAPKSAAHLVAQINRLTQASACYDWGGGLIWLEVDETKDVSSSDIRRLLAQYGGHATLIRGRPEIRQNISPFHPLDPNLMMLTRQIKKSFDPHAILNPGRMYAGI